MRRQIFFASLQGFDTHAGETDTLNTLYAELSPALAAFYAPLNWLDQAIFGGPSPTVCRAASSS